MNLWLLLVSFSQNCLFWLKILRVDQLELTEAESDHTKGVSFSLILDESNLFWPKGPALAVTSKVGQYARIWYNMHVT